MKRTFYFLVILIQNLGLQCSTLTAQSLTPQVIATGGGYQSNAAGSLSFTIGETNIHTLNSATHILTQGFQQPLEITLLHVKAYLQGFYLGSGQMADVLYNQGVYTNASLDADSVDVELHDANSPYSMLFQQRATLKQDGSLSVRGLGQIGQAYYFVLKHRNHIETWSANPVVLNATTTYDFSAVPTQAFGANQVEVEIGSWALFCSDINQDGVVDGLDYNDWEADNNNFGSGYLSTDLNGDGIVDGLDFLLWETNNNAFVGMVQP